MAFALFPIPGQPWAGGPERMLNWAVGPFNLLRVFIPRFLPASPAFQIITL